MQCAAVYHGRTQTVVIADFLGFCKNESNLEKPDRRILLRLTDY
ncbi:hypothetical protein MRBBS_0678 [Marinobacter sp. BSs20148]|nr:hypothetical protein MRBBS_0678 [Marinobacter sp. BSs20148]